MTPNNKGKYTLDDALINKAAAIKRCVTRAHEEYLRAPASFATNFTRQDAAALNIHRACEEAVLDMGQNLICRERLGVPQSARDIFTLQSQSQRIDPSLTDSFRRMVGFRDIAALDYQALQLPIMMAIIKKHLDEFLHYS